MRFEVSERVKTRISCEELLTALEAQFKKVSHKVQRKDQTLVVDSVEASFGSINRRDTSTITLKKANGGWLIVADVHYRPSVWFWIFLIVFLFTWVLWLLPIVFYLTQKKTVREAIEKSFQRIRNEYDQSMIPEQALPSQSPIDHLEQLGKLKEKGLITAEEFDMKKKELLGF